MLDNTLSRAERLRSLSAIRRLFGEGKSGFAYPFRYNFLIHNATQPASEEQIHSSECVKIMFSVPKRFHKRANKRNLLRRRSKEAYRLNKLSLHEAVEAKGLDLDIALVYSTKEELSYKTIENAVRRILAEVQERC